MVLIFCFILCSKPQMPFKSSVVVKQGAIIVDHSTAIQLPILL